MELLLATTYNNEKHYIARDDYRSGVASLPIYLSTGSKVEDALEQKAFTYLKGKDRKTYQHARKSQTCEVTRKSLVYVELVEPVLPITA